MEEAFEDNRGELSETGGRVGLPLWGQPTCSWKTRNLSARWRGASPADLAER